MSLLETMPSSFNATPFMLGAVAFHRCAYGVYDELSGMGYDIAEGGARLPDMVTNPGSRAHQMLSGELRDLLGRAPEDSEFDYAVKGFIAEAKARYFMRATEIEIVRMQERLAGLEAFDGASFHHAADLFRHGR
jgi:hypothetical protein